jgi:hypothetical protein
MTRCRGNNSVLLLDQQMFSRRAPSCHRKRTICIIADGRQLASGATQIGGSRTRRDGDRYAL